MYVHVLAPSSMCINNMHAHMYTLQVQSFGDDLGPRFLLRVLRDYLFLDPGPCVLRLLHVDRGDRVLSALQVDLHAHAKGQRL